MSDIVKIIKSMPDYKGSDGRTDKEIIAAEKELGVSFAEEYRKYLKEIGLACFDGRELTGLTETKRLNVVLVTKEQKAYLDIAEPWYVVEEANIDGIVIWQDSEGTIYQTAPNAETLIMAKSLSEYLAGEEEESQPQAPVPKTDSTVEQTKRQDSKASCPLKSFFSFFKK